MRFFHLIVSPSMASIHQIFVHKMADPSVLFNAKRDPCIKKYIRFPVSVSIDLYGMKIIFEVSYVCKDTISEAALNLRW